MSYEPFKKFTVFVFEHDDDEEPPSPDPALLLETGDYLLLETGDNLLLEGA